MTKEKIREGIKKILTQESFGDNWETVVEFRSRISRIRTDQILEFLDSQGVVLKVEGELPAHKLKNAKLVDASRLLYEIDEEFGKFTFTADYKVNYICGYSDAEQAMREAGYTKTERLI